MQTFVERVEAALSNLQQGKMIILVDHADREDEGDLIFPAELTTPENINFMLRHCSGIICLSLTEKQITKLRLPYMISPGENSSQRGTPFTISIEARNGVTTGVSAADRATTILTAINENAKEEDLVKPGHVFPLHAKAGGVLERAGHTEGAIDLVRLAGFMPAAVLCEIMNQDGSMARGNQLLQFAQQHDLMILSIEDIIEYRLRSENHIKDEVSASLPLAAYGEFKVSVVQEKHNSNEHVVLFNDKIKSSHPPLVRVHSSCTTGDIFGSCRCDCHQQLHYSLQRISDEGGILIYLDQEGRGVGLFNKIKAYSLQETGLDTVEANLSLNLPADARNYAIAANILKNRKMQAIRLLTNNPAKVNDLTKYGIDVIQREPLPIFVNDINRHYLLTKKNKLNHIIHHKEL